MLKRVIPCKIVCVYWTWQPEGCHIDILHHMYSVSKIFCFLFLFFSIISQSVVQHGSVCELSVFEIRISPFITWAVSTTTRTLVC